MEVAEKLSFICLCSYIEQWLMVDEASVVEINASYTRTTHISRSGYFCREAPKQLIHCPCIVFIGATPTFPKEIR